VEPLNIIIIIIMVVVWQVPGFIIGIESCLADAALSEAPPASPVTSSDACAAWAWGACNAHSLDDEDGEWDHGVTVTDHLKRNGGGAPRLNLNAVAKFGPLPACARESLREMLASSYVFDLDADTVTCADPVRLVRLDREAPPPGPTETLLRRVQVRMVVVVGRRDGNRTVCVVILTGWPQD
jgi:hypothetical protein